MEKGIILPQELVPAQIEFLKSRRFEWKDFIPGWGIINYMKRGLNNESYRKVQEFIDQHQVSPLEEIAKLGLAEWPRNPEVIPEQVKLVRRNGIMAAYHSVAIVGIYHAASSLYSSVAPYVAELISR